MFCPLTSISIIPSNLTDVLCYKAGLLSSRLGATEGSTSKLTKQCKTEAEETEWLSLLQELHTSFWQLNATLQLRTQLLFDNSELPRALTSLHRTFSICPLLKSLTENFTSYPSLNQYSRGHVYCVPSTTFLPSWILTTYKSFFRPCMAYTQVFRPFITLLPSRTHCRYPYFYSYFHGNCSFELAKWMPPPQPALLKKTFRCILSICSTNHQSKR